MRVFRLIILIILAGLTVILLATAVYAMQTPLPAPISHWEENRVQETAVYPHTAALFFHQNDPSIVDILP